MKDLTVVEITTIFSNIATVCGVIISIIAIYFSVKQSREQYKISQYENRKKIYDFFKDFKDNWLFYIDMASRNIERSFYIAMNGFSDDEKEAIQSNDITAIVLDVKKHYNYQHDKLNEAAIYYNFSKEDAMIVASLLKILEEYFSSFLTFSNILKEHSEISDSERKNILKQMDGIVQSFYHLLESEELESIIEKMKRELSIK